MTALRTLAIPFAFAALGVAGCTTTAPVQVTRFHLAQPIAPGSISVETGIPAGAAGLGPDSLESQGYNSIVAQRLAGVGFSPAAVPAQSELVATVTVDRGTRQDLAARQSGFSFGIGGFGGGGGWRHGGTSVGGGVGATVPIGGNQPHYIIGTRLMVQLKRRSEGTVIWEGRAMTESKASDPASQPDAAVAKLADAMFAGFPGESGRTITVK